MRSVNIHGLAFQVADEPVDYWGWIEEGRYHLDFSTIQRFASPDVTCIDAGAWIGAQTLYASQMYKHVHAIEPDPVALEILKQNLAANSLSNVTLHECALMDYAGTTSMGGQALGCSCTRETCLENSVTVPCMTLREFAKDIPDPLFIKMDVEGAEAKILRDWEFFAERKPDLMLSTHLIWWQEAGSSGQAEFRTISQVGRLYRHALHLGTSDPVNLSTAYGDVIFTDQ